MGKNRIVIPADEIQDNMLERAARTHVKHFTESSCHAPFLQGLREKGQVGTIVKKTTTGDLINTCAFGGRRARDREENNRLKRRVYRSSKTAVTFPNGE